MSTPQIGGRGREVQKQRNSLSKRGKMGTQGQMHSLDLSLKTFTDTHNDDGYVDSMSCASW